MQDDEKISHNDSGDSEQGLVLRERFAI